MERGDFITKIILTDFGHLAYHHNGNYTSETAIVFLHGHFNNSLESNSWLIFKDTGKYLNVLLDHRWHGSSTRTKFYPTFEERSEDIDLLISNMHKHFPHLKNISLVGFSQGGTVLLHHLLNKEINPVIKSIYLVSPRLEVRTYRKWFAEECERMNLDNVDFFSKKYKTKGLVNFNAKFVDDLVMIDLFSDIHRLTMPITILYPEKDELTPRSEVERFVGLNPKLIRLIQLPDHHHVIKSPEWPKLGVFLESELSKMGEYV